MTIHEKIVQDAESFCKRRGLSESKFGHLSTGDHKVVRKLRGGRDIVTSTLEKIYTFMGKKFEFNPER